jgi:hypothetical protein
MNMKKSISLIAALAALGSLALAIPVFAQTGPGTGQGGFGRMRGGQPPAVMGTVSAINGNTLTVAGRQGFGSTAVATTYSVDATNATVTKNNAASTVSGISMGDTVFVQGTVTGTNVTATTIRDGNMANGLKNKMGTANPAGGTGIRGAVASISGTTLTVTSKAPQNGGTATTYTVDASNATVTKNNAASTVSGISAGDTIMVQGTVNGTSVTAKTIRDGVTQPAIQGNGEPVVAGSVTAISENTITITNKSNITYAVDATNAKFVVAGVTGPTISNVAVGDNLVIQGTVNGTNVTASSVIDQKPAANSNTSNQGNGQQPKPGIMGGIGHMFGGIGNFFKHMFGF